MSKESQLLILFEDEDLLLVSKPGGLLSHPHPNSEDAPSVESICSRRLGKEVILLHRLDQVSSGLMLIAKNKRYSSEFRKLFDEHRIRKSYLAIVEGRWPRALQKLGGRDAEGRNMESSCRVVAESDEWTRIEVLIKTGRRHQIRIQCKDAGHPIWGDGLYGSRHPQSEWIALHAHELRFTDPRNGKEQKFQAPLPHLWPAEWRG